MRVVAMVPARMAATRFPGKPMAKISDIPMIGHVYFRTAMSPNLESTFVATCDQEIFDYIEGIGGKAIMTSSSHERCTDRCAEALQIIEAEQGQSVDVIVMAQGDEPLLNPAMIGEVVQPFLENPDTQVSNLIAPIDSHEEWIDPKTVKVVCDKAGRILYLSREPIPSSRKSERSIKPFKQTGIIAFRREALLGFYGLKPTTLEEIESVDMLRLLEHGLELQGVITKYKLHAVDTPQDLIDVQMLMNQDTMLRLYCTMNVE